MTEQTIAIIVTIIIIIIISPLIVRFIEKMNEK